MEASVVAASKIELSLQGRPIRPLFVVPASPSKTSMIFVRRQIAHLQSSGALCTTFFLRSRVSPWILLKEWQRFRKAIKSAQPDVVHAQYGTMTALFSVMSAPVPVVLTYRGTDLNPCPSAPLRSLAGRLLSQLASLRASAIICVSEQLRQQLWWRRDRAVVIPTGVDTEVFCPFPINEARAKLGWRNDERVVLFNAGKFPKKKRKDLAEAAVAAAQRICGEIRFFVLNGDVQPEIIPVIMNAADCLLLTSDWEGSPNVIKEAMACNLPAVSVDVGDVRQRLDGVWPSRIVERNPEALGRAIADILTRRERSNGSVRIRDLNSVVVAQQIISLYGAAIASSRNLLNKG